MNKRSTHASSLITGRQQRRRKMHPLLFFFRPSQCCGVQGCPHLWMHLCAALATFKRLALLSNEDQKLPFHRSSRSPTLPRIHPPPSIASPSSFSVSRLVRGGRVSAEGTWSDLGGRPRPPILSKRATRFNGGLIRLLLGRPGNSR